MVALNLALLLFFLGTVTADKRWSLGSEDAFKEHIMTLLADFKPCHAGETTPGTGTTAAGGTSENPGENPTTPGNNGGSSTGNPGGNSSPNLDGGNTGTTPGNGGGSSPGNPGGSGTTPGGPTTAGPGQTTPENSGGNPTTPGNASGSTTTERSYHPPSNSTDGGSSTGNPGGNPTTPENPGQGGNGSTPTSLPPPTCPACPIPTEKPCPTVAPCADCPAPVPQTCPLAPSCNPPRCSLQPVPVPWAANHPAQGVESCFNDGSLKTGDKIVIEGTTPPCCPEKLASDKLVWTVDLLSKDKKPWLHIAVVSGWQKLQITAGVGGWYKNVTKIVEVPCPFKPDADFMVEITNSQEKFDIVLNGKTFTYGHQVPGDHGDQYYNLLMVSYSPLKLKKVAVVRGEASSPIGLTSAENCPACPTSAACPAAPTCPAPPACSACPKPTEKVCPTVAPCPTTTPTPKKPICDADWKYYADTKSCYFLGIKKLTNMDAKNECRKQDATLASIHSDAENMFIYNWLNSSTTTETNFNAWIGAYRTGLGKETFANFDGTPVDYVKWDQGDPNNLGGNEYCVELFSHAPYNRDTKWNDRNCHIPPPAYVCKKPANL